MASIRQLSNKHWQVQIRRHGSKPVCKTFIKYEFALKWAHVIESELDRGVFIPRDSSERITLSELIARYSTEITPYKKSAARELSRLKLLNESFGDLTLASLQPQAIAVFRDHRIQQGLSGATVVKDLNTLSHLIDTAMKEWGFHLPFNPVMNIRKPKVGGSRPRRLSKEEEIKLLKLCRQHSLMMESVVILAIETAMRLGEIMQLSWADCDITKRTVMIHETKNGEPRKIPLSIEAIRVLSANPRHLNTDKIFWQWSSVSSFESSWQRLIKRSGINNFRFHDLRHEATSRLFEKGLNMMEVSTITGHKTLQMLKRYTHLNVEEIALKLNNQM